MQKHNSLTVGFTYDLKSDYLARGYSEEEAAEYDSSETIQAIQSALVQMGCTVERIGGFHSLVKKLALGQTWDLVFNICEGERGSAREAQVPSLLEAYRIPCVFSDASVLSLTLNKSLTKSVMRDHGVATPKSWWLKDLNELNALATIIECDYPLFVKPASEGSSKGIHRNSLVRTWSELKSTVHQLSPIFAGGILIERYLPGREFTVGIKGNGGEAQVLGALEILFEKEEIQEVYSYETKQNYLEIIRYRLANDATSDAVAAVALRAWQVLGCRDLGRVDIRLDEKGVPHFLEVNPLAGLHPVNSDLIILSKHLGISYYDLISSAVNETLKRAFILRESRLTQEVS